MNTSPPDIRLARAFKFNMEDLTENIDMAQTFVKIGEDEHAI